MLYSLGNGHYDTVRSYSYGETMLQEQLSFCAASAHSPRTLKGRAKPAPRLFSLLELDRPDNVRIYQTSAPGEKGETISGLALVAPGVDGTATADRLYAVWTDGLRVEIKGADQAAAGAAIGEVVGFLPGATGLRYIRNLRPFRRQGRKRAAATR